MPSSAPHEPLRHSPTAGGARDTVLPGDVTSPVERTTSDTVVGAAAATTRRRPARHTARHTARTHLPGTLPRIRSAPTAAARSRRPSQNRRRPSPLAIFDDVTVKPQPSDRDVGRAKADEIDQLIDISEILKPPPRPVVLYAIAAVLFVAGLAWALIGGGVTERPDHATVDRGSRDHRRRCRRRPRRTTRSRSTSSSRSSSSAFPRTRRAEHRFRAVRDSDRYGDDRVEHHRGPTE